MKSRGIYYLLLFALFFSCGEEENVQIPKYIFLQNPIRGTFTAGEENIETVRVKVTNVDSVAISGIRVYFTISEGQATRSDSVSITDKEGIASSTITLSSVKEKVAVKIQAEGLLETPLYVYFEIGSAPASKIEIVSGNNQEGLSNTKLPANLSVKLMDQFDNLVSNETVEFKIISGGGSLMPASVETNMGIASTEYTLGTTTQVSVIQASVGDQLKVNFNCYMLSPVQCTASLNEKKNAVINWTKSESPYFQSYLVYRSEWGYTNFSIISRIDDVNINSFTDAISSLGVSYEYYVRTTTIKGNFADSERVKIEPGNAIILPYAEDCDVALDRSRGLFYLATRNQEKIFIISSSTLSKADSIIINYYPYRVAINNDFSKLYVVPSGENFIDVFSTTSLALIERLSMTALIGNDPIYDVHVSKNDQLFVSSSAIIKVDNSTGSIKKVASGYSFFIERVRFVDDDGQYLYMEVSNLTPNSLFKLDISEENAPLVLRSESSSINNTEEASLSPDGKLIYLNSGEIVSTENFDIVSRLPQSVSGLTLSDNGSKVYGIAHQSFQVQAIIRWDAITFVEDFMRQVGFVPERIHFYNNELFVVGKNFQEQWRLFKISDLPIN